MDFEKENVKEKQEYGKNVKIKIKFIRHGEKDKDGNLLDYGREITRKRVEDSDIEKGQYDAVKAIGSGAGPKVEIPIKTTKENETFQMARSTETAHIYAQEIEGDDQFQTRINNILSYETLKNPTPHDHKAVYNSYLPDNFNELSPKEKSIFAKKAQTATINHLLSLSSPEAENHKKEVAGSFSYVIEHYKKMSQKLKSKSKVLIPAGTHGGLMEFLLQQALVRFDEQEKKIIGFQDINEIGGEFDPSETYDVDISTDANGISEKLKVNFDRPDRPQGEMYLDLNKIKELAKYYEDLHFKKE